MSEEWGDWIEHDGRGCPIEVMGREIECYWRPEDGDELNWRHGIFMVDDLVASCSTWWAAQFEGRGVQQHWNGQSWPRGPYWIDRYRIRKPKALAELKRMIADQPETVDA